MTSATNFIMPIIKVDTHKISNGKPGSFSQRLRKEFINSI
jgi:branched-subunit amino acid aminotransferase/4-amino-4-deoxychorismate lyase